MTDPFVRLGMTPDEAATLCDHDNIQTVEDARGNLYTFCADCGETIGVLRDRLDAADAALQVIASIADDLDNWAAGKRHRGFARRQARRLREHVAKVDAALGL